MKPVMKPGTILYDTDFEYRDGESGDKLLILLNNGEVGFYIVVKTTSNGIFKSRKSGCQLKDKHPNFFLPKGSCWFDKDTWVGLNEFFPFDAKELLNKHFSRQLEIKAYLSFKITKSLLACAIRSDDIILLHRNILNKILTSL